ncbi:MAG: hypothetical protein RIQ56_61 [Candidatus Parcubacteria bacterium]|jgi:DHA1 family tetracycline resistance protein-like MFS transporter
MNKKYLLPILFVTLLLDMVGVGMVIPIIPILFTDPASSSFLLQGYSQSGQFFIAGLVTALFGLMQFLAAPVLGELSDIYGRKKLLTLGVGILALSQILFGFAVEIGSVALILFSRAVAGLAGGNFSIAQASVADISEPGDRAKNFGLIGAAFGIGFIVGPVLGGWIATLAQDPAVPFWCAGALGILNVLFITLFLPETRVVVRARTHSFTLLRGINNIRAAFKDVDARPIYTASFLYVCGFSFMVSFMGVLLVNKFSFSESAIGTFFGAVGIWMVFTQIVIIRILSRIYSERQILRFSMPTMALALVAFPFAPSPAVLYTLMPFIAIPQGLSMSNLGALVSKSVSKEKQGAALGINSSLLALAQGTIPLVAGLGSGVFGVSVPFFAGALCVMAGWYVLFVIRRMQS